MPARACRACSRWPGGISLARRSRSCPPPRLLTDGVQLNNSIPCNPANPVGGQNFANYPPSPTWASQPPFLTDFAHACQTAFAGLSLRLTAKRPGGGRRQVRHRRALAAAPAATRSPDRCNRPPVSAGSPRTRSERDRAGEPAGHGADRGDRGVGDLAPADRWWSARRIRPGRRRPRSVPRSAQNLRTLMRATVTAVPARAAECPGHARLRPGRHGPARRRAREMDQLVRRIPGGVAFAAVELTKRRPPPQPAWPGSFLRGFPASS